MKVPTFEIASILEDIKTRISAEDKEKLSWCISQLIESSGKTDLTTHIQSGNTYLTEETLSQIEQHSSLPLIRLAISDEEISRKSINRRISLSSSSSLDLEISLPSANFDINDFNINIFELAKEFGEATLLSIYAQKIFAYWNLFISMGFDLQVFLRYCQYIGEGYKPNLYHNVLHAADVMQACHVFMISTNIVELSEMIPLHIAALMLSAMVHDYKHPGVSNSYLYMIGDKLAIRYNDVSILENYHVSKAFQIALKENMNIFSNISKEEYRTLRKLMINAVLGTDMTKHPQHVSNLSKLSQNNDLKGEKELLISLFMHLGDLSNPSRIEKICEEWTLRICEEFFLQGDKERSNNIPVSPLMDRYLVNIAKSQIGFISGVILPFITPLCREIKGLDFLVTNAQANKEVWAGRINEFEEKIVKSKDQSASL
ncbi:hypothetical protein SteCoe_26383 [Stentor coeruleus]|uniref:Phosphodiesterase n=1 Tax=Stentor coeruleus TaxID=5963 RepID=A0A1R2BD08_9CILI|nr:hypothetical protein SteCoe_26383 [Stentor coeruleus]